MSYLIFYRGNDHALHYMRGIVVVGKKPFTMIVRPIEPLVQNGRTRGQRRSSRTVHNPIVFDERTTPPTLITYSSEAIIQANVHHRQMPATYIDGFGGRVGNIIRSLDGSIIMQGASA